VSNSPNRIPIILEAIQRLWEASPNLRLGQLIVGIAREADMEGVLPFYLEDDELLRTARKMREQHEDPCAAAKCLGV
jgi:uncharacterized protein YihD (DUF1040 family)